MDLVKDIAEQIAWSVWKCFPFRAGNRMWLLVLFQTYVVCLFACFVIACTINSIEGQHWLESDSAGHGVRGTGNTALDEIFWFVLTRMHGVGFGEFLPRTPSGRIISMFVCSIGYWLPIYLAAIIVLSQLPGERMPTLSSVFCRVVDAVWPSYVVLIVWILVSGALCNGYYLTHDSFNDGQIAPNTVGWEFTGINWMWTVAHRMPYGDVWPEKSLATAFAVITGFLGNLYMPYALALVAVRRPNAEQHQSLLDNLRSHPRDVLGRGYSVPSGLKESVMEEYAPSGAA